MSADDPTAYDPQAGVDPETGAIAPSPDQALPIVGPGPGTIPVVVDPGQPMEAVVGPVIVLEHCLDEVQGVYRLVIGRRVTVPSTETTEEIDLGTADEFDYVFASDDRRWFNEDGTRRSGKDVAAEQKQEVRDALEQQAEQSQQIGNPRPLPGVGEEL